MDLIGLRYGAESPLLSMTDTKILIVDDEKMVRNICGLLLRDLAGEIVSVSSGEEALARLDENFDIILTDLDMPGSVDGGELTRRVRAAGSADVLIMTGHPDLSTAIQAVKDGAYDYLIKPFTADTLRAAVRRCIDRRRLSQELAREKALRAELDRAYSELSEMEKVRELFGQFTTPEVAQFVMAHPEDFWKRGERRTVTVLFADVRGFTAFAARVPPERAVEALNEVFEVVIGAVQTERGIVNKFLGDGVMALFGAPLPAPDHASAAARAALKARAGVRALAGKPGMEFLRVGMALNTGEVIAGCLGVRERTEYSVIGHPVNLAARLEKVSEPGQILLGPDTTRFLSGNFLLRDLGTLALAGVTGPVQVHELSDPPSLL